MSERTIPTRRQPPPFRRVSVGAVEERSPRLVRITLTGPELDGLTVDEPAASVRLLLPTDDGLELPEWDGNEFLLADGSRPHIRTLTPRALRPDEDELDVEVVLHGDGALGRWAGGVEVGAEAAVSGTGRGYDIDGDASSYLLVGDETAIPAIAQLMEWIPGSIDVAVAVEIAAPDARLDLPDHPKADVEWHELGAGEDPGTRMLAAVEAATIDDRTKVWVAGEAAGVFQIRKHLFDERDLDRSAATVRGYWKAGRAAS